MSINIDNKAWDSYRDKLDYSKWNNEGVAELWRIYTMNGSPIYKHTPNDDEDKDIIPYPIKAKGITAFLADENVFSLANLIRGKWNRNALTFYKPYFDKCISNLRRRETNKSSLAFIDYSEIELIKQHIESEKKLFAESNFFYNEIFKSINEDELLSERNTLKEIKEVALFYPEWVKKTYFSEHNQENITETKIQQVEISRPGRKPSPIKSLDEYFIKIEGVALNALLNELKNLSKDFSSKQFVFMVRALDNLGYLKPYDNKGIFDAFEKFLEKKYGNTPGKNANMNKAKDATNNGSKDELLLNLERTIDGIISNIIIKK